MDVRRRLGPRPPAAGRTAVTVTDDEFVDLLENSQAAVDVVEAFLRRAPSTRFCQIEVPPIKIRPVRELAKFYSDAGDIRILWCRKWRVIEVKQKLKVNFRDRATFPFPSVYVGREHLVVGREALAYFICSQDLRCAAVCYGDDRNKWFTEEKICCNRHQNKSQCHERKCIPQIESLDGEKPTDAGKEGRASSAYNPPIHRHRNQIMQIVCRRTRR